MSNFLKFLKWFGLALAFLVVVMFVLIAANSLLPDTSQLKTPFWLIGLAAVALSIFFSYTPKIRTAFAALPDNLKALVNVVSVMVVAVVMFLFVCLRLIQVAGLECTISGAQTLLSYVAIAVAGNQIADYFSVDSADVKALKVAAKTITP
ncbi:MAG: hypothetical protein M0R06_08350 [Sphaerochaeta sp.]|jgi:hypothetical protein|nr:hypothetical protein [Sphaerochaeta sp.]